MPLGVMVPSFEVCYQNGSPGFVAAVCKFLDDYPALSSLNSVLLSLGLDSNYALCLLYSKVKY
jgi:hypothetical protein